MERLARKGLLACRTIGFESLFKRAIIDQRPHLDHFLFFRPSPLFYAFRTVHLLAFLALLRINYY